MAKLNEDLKVKVTEIDRLKSEVEMQTTKNKELDSDLKTKDTEIEKLKTEVETQKKKNNVSTGRNLRILHDLMCVLIQHVIHFYLEYFGSSFCFV